MAPSAATAAAAAPGSSERVGAEAGAPSGGSGDMGHLRSMDPKVEGVGDTLQANMKLPQLAFNGSKSSRQVLGASMLGEGKLAVQQGMRE